MVGVPNLFKGKRSSSAGGGRVGGKLRWSTIRDAVTHSGGGLAIRCGPSLVAMLQHGVLQMTESVLHELDFLFLNPTIPGREVGWERRLTCKPSGV